MYENTQKMQQNQKALHNLQSHLAYQYIKMCVLTRYPFCESLVKFLWCIFQTYRAVFPFCDKKNSVGNQKSGFVWQLKYYVKLSKNISDLYISCCKQERGRRHTTTGDIDMSETCQFLSYVDPIRTEILALKFVYRIEKAYVLPQNE